MAQAMLDPALPLIPIRDALERARESYRAEQDPTGVETTGIASTDDGEEDATATGTPEPDYSALVCPNCALTFEEFRKEGRLGCGSCYDAFEAPLKLILFRIHGDAEGIHRGHRPGQPAEGSRGEIRIRINQLQRQMLAAVEAEAYERAAGLRDQITALEKGLAAATSARGATVG